MLSYCIKITPKLILFTLKHGNFENNTKEEFPKTFINFCAIMDLLAGKTLYNSSGDEVSADEALKGKEIIGLYFSAHWCPPCRMFTPMLKNFYRDLMQDDEPFEIVFVSSDWSLDDMLEYMQEAHGDWLGSCDEDLKKDASAKYGITGIPLLVVVTIDGKLLRFDARSEIQAEGTSCFQKWMDEAKG